MTFGRIVLLLSLLTASVWAALVNGQPYFMADTSAYVREPDFAVVYLFGDKFATTWTQERTLERNKDGPTAAGAKQPAYIPLNSPFDKAVLGGRSIYYGALLYAGYVTSYFWLSILLQGLIFIYLSYVFLIKCARLSFASFALITSTVLILTPVSFFISFLMPDIFASFLMLSTMVLVGFWKALNPRDKVFISIIIFYSALAHTSHLLLLLFLALTTVCITIAARRRPVRPDAKTAILLLAVFVCGALGEVAFSYATNLTIGATPIRPPFVMARLIDDGPGYRFLQKNCPTKPYVVCNYMDRLPTASDYFLWSTDPTKGVYNTTDVPSRSALVSEQFSFAIDVFRYDPLGVIMAAVKNAIHQLGMIGLVAEFSHDQPALQTFKHFVPSFLHSDISENFLTSVSTWFFAIYFLSMTALASIFAFWLFVCFQKRPSLYSEPQWLYVLSIAICGIVFNAAICGALSTPHTRYQTRISWIPLFILLALIAKLWEASHLSKRHGFVRGVESIDR